MTSNRRELVVGPIFPGSGYPSRPGEDRPGLSPFGRLAMGQTLGKSSILIYDSAQRAPQRARVDMITVEGDDLDSQQLVITLHPPRVIPLAIEDVYDRLDKQNLTGEQTNAEVTTHAFPGTRKPIRWPPLEAVIEFGTGGVSTQVFVDYLNGVTLSVIASYLRVYALVSQSKENGDIYGTDAAYYLAAHVGPGFAVPHVQRTVFVGDVGDENESGVFDTPRFTKVATLVGGREHHSDHPPVITEGFIRFWQSPDGTGTVGDFFFSGKGSVPVEVPNTGLYFSVFNKSGHRMKMSVIFEFAL